MINHKPHCFDHWGVSQLHRCPDPSPGHCLPSPDTHLPPPTSLVPSLPALLWSVLLLTLAWYSSMTSYRPTTRANPFPQVTTDHFLSLKCRHKNSSTSEWGKSPAPPRKSGESRSLRISDPYVSKLFCELGPLALRQPWVWKSNMLSSQEILHQCPERAPLSQVGKPLRGGLGTVPFAGGCQPGINLGFSSRGHQRPQASSKPEADGPHTG